MRAETSLLPSIPGSDTSVELKWNSPLSNDVLRRVYTEKYIHGASLDLRHRSLRLINQRLKREGMAERKCFTVSRPTEAGDGQSLTYQEASFVGVFAV